MNEQLNKDNLFRALGLFIEGFRAYVISVMLKEHGDTWPAEFVDALNPEQRERWNDGLRNGSDPASLIDYPHLKSFSITFKHLIRSDFKRDTGSLPTWLLTIYNTRNKLVHFSEVTPDEFTEAFIQMKRIAHLLGMTDLEQELSRLQESKTQTPTPKPAALTVKSGEIDLSPWFRQVTPHLDIKQGRLDESVFAANLAEVARGNGRAIYNNPVEFFTKTYLTAGLRNVARTVIRGLNGDEDANNRVISLQTGFGGGKTHTLISLYHLCKWGKESVNSPLMTELFSYTGAPEFEKVNVAVFTNTTTDPANGRIAEDGIRISTMWGELAYQLGGKAAYEIVRANDEQLIAPGGLFRKVLAQCSPALILVDELADYCVKAAARQAVNSSLADQTISFMQELTEAIAETNHCVAVITLPASVQEVGNTKEAQSILDSLERRVSRVSADTKPVADDEIFEVIRRRLFDSVGSPSEIEAVATAYADLYIKFKSDLPAYCTKVTYRQKLIDCYPFHPDLIDVFRVRWASHHNFQRTRGVLRLLAAIVSDLWKRQHNLAGPNLLIHTGDLNFANLDSLSGQLKRLYGNGYDSVIAGDVAGPSSNAFKIDGDKEEYGKWNLSQAISSVILMNSFGTEGSNKGVSVAEIKLSLITPSGFNHNSINGALDQLESKAYYLYYAQTGGSEKRYWFYTKPNINILINQAKSDVKEEDIHAEILTRVRKHDRNIQLFNMLVDPTESIPEQQKLTLVVLSPKYLATPSKLFADTQTFIDRVATKKGNNERVFRNTMLFLACSEVGYNALKSSLSEYLACKRIQSDFKNNLEQEQHSDLRKRLEDADRQTEASLCPAFSLVIKSSASKATILALTQFKSSFDQQVNQNIIARLKEEEWLLESVGLATLESINRLPTAEKPIRALDVYEDFLRFDDKPMITGKQAVENGLLRYTANGEFCIGSGDGKTFSTIYFKQSVPFFDVTDETYWLLDKSHYREPVSEVTAATSAAKDSNTVAEPVAHPISSNQQQPSSKSFKSITVSGHVPLERYTELFQYFISPFAMNSYKIDIKVSFDIRPTGGASLDESNSQYKSAKEAARQLGLDLREEE